MDKYTIRTSATDSVKGLPSKQKLDIQLKQTTKTLPFPNVSSTLSQRTVYEEERQAGSKFRLILTVVPYCSNVLFNALTEIVKNEGSSNPTVITDQINISNDKDKKVDINDAIGKVNPSRVEMISNTEYSSEKHGGYEYHPGYDFFDNHLLRNQSFKIVNPLYGKTNRNVFNTLSDYMRDRNGTIKKYNKRISIDNLKNESFSESKHLYMHDDILSIDESINQNLREDNGWWGFTNNTSIDSKELNKRKWSSIDISKALNNYRSCEFVDMYPDRTLFSFTPKFNNFTHENENNWNIVLTYPYKNIYNHPICLGGSSYIKKEINGDGEEVDTTVSEGNRWMGLKILSVQLGSGKIGGNTLVFRTYTKHGLSQGDMFYLYFTNPYEESGNYSACDKFSDNTLTGDEIYYESETYHKVTNVGDLSKNNNEYYFYTSDLSLLDDIYQRYLLYVQNLINSGAKDTEIPFFEDYKTDDKKDIYDSDNVLKTTLLNKLLRYSNFRIRRCVGGVKSSYYIRQFRKIPNLRGAMREMTDEEMLHKSKFNGVFENYVKENAIDPINPSYQRLFNNEIYQLGFASNIYNDNITQITFTDGIETKGLTDNLGRPLSQIYYTVVKNNAGHEAWYDNENPKYKVDDDVKKTYGNDYKIEFSHCFGKVTSGLEMHIETTDTETIVGPISYWKKLGSINHITNIVNDNIYDKEVKTNNEEINTVEPIRIDKDSKPLETDIHFYDTFFNGDLVEFNAFECTEKVISNIMHRFNTAQRETITNKYYSQYNFHEIISDDYDKDGFNVIEYSAVNGVKDTKGDTTKYEEYNTISRPEGYYYKAHYPIQIREYTRIQQGSHYTLKVKNAKPIQNNGILIQVTTSNSHNLNLNDVIFICDDDADIRYITRCVGIINRTTFLMSPNYFEYITNATDFEDKEINSNIERVTKDEKETWDYKEKYSWLQLCDILNGKYAKDLNYPTFILRRKNPDIPDYATYIGGNKYFWRNLVNIGDSSATSLEDYVFANGYFYITQNINFFLKRQDPFGITGLYFDGDDKFPYFPNDPVGIKTSENNYITKDTSPSC